MEAFWGFMEAHSRFVEGYSKLVEGYSRFVELHSGKCGRMLQICGGYAGKMEGYPRSA